MNIHNDDDCWRKFEMASRVEACHLKPIKGFGPFSASNNGLVFDPLRALSASLRKRLIYLRDESP